MASENQEHEAKTEDKEQASGTRHGMAELLERAGVCATGAVGPAQKANNGFLSYFIPKTKPTYCLTVSTTMRGATPACFAYGPSSQDT